MLEAKTFEEKAEQKQKIKNEKIVQKDNKSSSDQSSNQKKIKELKKSLKANRNLQKI